jgi:hypothetical protein
MQGEDLDDVLLTGTDNLRSHGGSTPVLKEIREGLENSREKFMGRPVWTCCLWLSRDILFRETVEKN